MSDLINIENKILVIRGQQVMLDRDLAELYGVETKNINKAMSRNKERFPINFCFQLTADEFASLRFQNGTSNKKGGRRYLPFVFTEQGVAMLSGVLHSDIAVKVSISIMNAFVHMRHYLNNNSDYINQVNKLETKVDLKFVEYDKNFTKIFKVLDSSPKSIKQGVFVQGQIFDAYIRNASDSPGWRMPDGSTLCSMRCSTGGIYERHNNHRGQDTGDQGPTGDAGPRSSRNLWVFNQGIQSTGEE